MDSGRISWLLFIKREQENEQTCSQDPGSFGYLHVFEFVKARLLMGLTTIRRHILIIIPTKIRVISSDLRY